MKSLLASIPYLFVCAAALQAAPVTFLYQSTTDATGVGGPATIPVSLAFTFDSALPNGSGSFDISPQHGSYGPWDGVLRIGDDTLTLTGGTIFLWNDISVTYADGSVETSDGYDFRWDRSDADSLYGGGSSGTLFGQPLDFFRILIVDTDHNMFSNNSLPIDPSFSLRGDFIQDEYDSGGEFGLDEFSGPGRAYSLTLPVPEPASAPLALVGLAFAAKALRKRRRANVLGY
jgi:hypothetical protein